jgi:hypothetical protein
MRDFPRFVGGQGVWQRRFRLKSQPDLCGRFILHWNARAPRAKCCLVRTAYPPVALLREAFARWPPWSSPSKRSVLWSAMALGFERPVTLLFPAVSRLLPGWRAPACALRHGSAVPKIGGARSAVSHGRRFWGSDRCRSRESVL